ncbi:urease accessory protein UreG [Klebsiella pneumoniae]|uniref:Urease accessory protein UreG n=9 Tax=Klebsiella pneumoniae TaxID=573 RepID=A0A378A876_KLEPN|nr:urease accessory protein UreG [Klebsiella pneumoniae]
MKKITRLGIGGPVGSGKTAIIEVITPKLIERGYKPLIITNDVVTTEDAKQVKRTLKGILDEERIMGVETGACPHTAVREDPSMNIAAVEEMEDKYPDSDLIMIESGGDNLTLTFSPALADFYIYVIDVAEGEKIPRKNGPGLVQADILIINKIDLAPYVGASLAVMEDDTKIVRGNRPYILTNCKTGEGIDAPGGHDRKRFPVYARKIGAIMQTKHKASPAFDTLSLGALAPELAKYQQEPPQMASGAVGKHGYLRLRFADRGAKSTLHEMERKVPLLVQKALYWDEEMPFLPCVPMISTSGCVLQGIA